MVSTSFIGCRQLKSIRIKGLIYNSKRLMESEIKAEFDEQKPSKKSMERLEKKLKKKIAQAQGVIVRAEQKPYEAIIWNHDKPSKYMLVTHFGNGDQVDQDVLQEYFEAKDVSVKQLTIFPGINYGHIEFEDEGNAERLMKGLEAQNTVNLAFTGSDNPNRTVVFFYTPCECSHLKKSENVDIAAAEVARTGAIPGLYVYDEIITKEEEAEMIKTID